MIQRFIRWHHLRRMNSMDCFGRSLPAREADGDGCDPAVELAHGTGPSLTWDDVQVGETMVKLKIGKVDIDLPDPLDEPWRYLSANPGHDTTASHPSSNWVFLGTSPGCHISASHLRTRLRLVLAPRAARLGTLHELTKLAPIAIIAEALGYSPATIERHAADSAAAYAAYISAIREA